MNAITFGGDEQIVRAGSYMSGYDSATSTLTTGTTKDRRQMLAENEREKTSQGQFCQLCHAWRGNLGLEPTPQLYVDHMVEVFREVRRVLRDDGVLWLNLGDSYSGGGGYWPGAPSESVSISGSRGRRGATTSYKGRQPADGLKPKDLIGIPWRVALALQADGWWLRNAAPWVKKSAMPESVRDRMTTAHEYVFLLAKNKRYFYDGEAVRGQCVGEYNHHQRKQSSIYAEHNGHSQKGGRETSALGLGWDNAKGRNRRTSDPVYESLDLRIEQQRAYLLHLENVRNNGGMLTSESGDPVAFLVNTSAYSGAHFATFPPKLIEPMIAAGTSEKGCCSECGANWERVVEKVPARSKKCPKTDALYNAQGGNGEKKTGTIGMSGSGRIDGHTTTIGWQPTCTCNAGAPIKCTVLDPFGGAGTTALQSDRMGCDAIIIELSETYVTDLAYPRVAGDAPMFTDVEIVR